MEQAGLALAATLGVFANAAMLLARMRRRFPALPLAALARAPGPPARGRGAPARPPRCCSTSRCRRRTCPRWRWRPCWSPRPPSRWPSPSRRRGSWRRRSWPRAPARCGPSCGAGGGAGSSIPAMPTSVVTGGAGLPGLAPLRPPPGPRATGCCASTTSTPARSRTSSTCATRAFVFVQHDLIDHVESPSRWTTSSTSPRRPARSTTCGCRCTRSRSARYGTHNALGLAKPTAPASCWPRPPRCTATPRSTPRREGYWGHVNPIGPRGVYDEAKRYAEALTMAYHRQQGVNTHIARIFNTYGPAHAAARRPRDPDVHPPGAGGQADHGVRRRRARRAPSATSPT